MGGALQVCQSRVLLLLEGGQPTAWRVDSLRSALEMGCRFDKMMKRLRACRLYQQQVACINRWPGPAGAHNPSHAPVPRGRR